VTATTLDARSDKLTYCFAALQAPPCSSNSNTTYTGGSQQAVWPCVSPITGVARNSRHACPMVLQPFIRNPWLPSVSSPLAPLVFRGVLGDGRNDVDFYYCCLCVVLSLTTGVPGSLAG
jgi:hypothetical protein